MNTVAASDDANRYKVDAVDKALRLLTLIAETPGLGLSELGRRSGESKARVYRLLRTLEARGFILCSAADRSYRLGISSLILGNAAGRQIDLAHMSAPMLRQLGMQTGETIQLRVRDGLETICIAGWEPDRELKVQATVGARRPMHAGSGMVFLAFVDETISAKVLASPLERFTDRTCVDPESLKTTLSRIRQEGIYVSRGEVSADLISISAPIFGSGDGIVATINIGAPASRVGEKQLPSHVAAIRSTAAALSGMLGYRPAS
jgi:IclR family KDG regulon transcriptional repressor